MKGENLKTWGGKLAGLVAVAGASFLLSMPVSAKSCNSASKPASPTSAVEAEVAGPAAAATSPSIVDIASKNDSFKTLTAALQAAGLVDTLAGKGPFTVFAPTDEAFAALPKGTVEQLLKPENKEKLVKILTYHVVPGAVKSGSLQSGDVATVEGSPVMVKLDAGKVMVNKANVIEADIEASNGVIHVIDKVILPPNM